jgi:iron(III) transport system ATP-binding protein
MTSLTVRNLTRSFGTFNAIDDISFEIRSGQFVTLLGPSGCGKSTTLWLLAGLDAPTAGSIRYGDQLIADAERNILIPPEERDFGLVFQSYAVWPHMTVRKNLEYPLKLRKQPRAQIDRRVDEIATLVELTSQLDKYPFQLSGGQQQRVALARTLIYQPRLLLLDEPLSNLDAKLRTRARTWLKQLHQSLKLTTIYVTHDQNEALAMSDEVIVLDRGVIRQRGTPEEIYAHPESDFVADFIGNSNVLPGRVVRAEGDRSWIELEGGPTVESLSTGYAQGSPVMVSIRQEAIRQVAPPEEDAVALPARVTSTSYLGSAYETELAFGQVTATAIFRSLPPSELTVYIRPEDCRVLPSDGRSA